MARQKKVAAPKQVVGIQQSVASDQPDEGAAILQVKELFKSSALHRKKAVAALLAAGKILLPIRLRHVSDWGKFVKEHDLAPHQVQRALKLAEKKVEEEELPGTLKAALAHGVTPMMVSVGGKAERSATVPDDFHFEHSRFQDLAVADGSADLVLADIPYAKEWLDQVEPLGNKIFDALKDGGAAVVWPGNSYVMEVANTLGKRLNLMRMVYTVYEGPKAVLWNGKNCRTPVQAEPLLIFAKGDWKKCRCFSNVSYSTGKEKSSGHSMQKPLADVARWIKILSEPGAHVLDLCAGSFTAALATWQVGEGRTYTGCEVEQKWVDVGRKRFAEFVANGEPGDDPINDAELENARQYLQAMGWDVDRSVRTIREYVSRGLPLSDA
jgi:SAM-dependent methyltransferase